MAFKVTYDGNGSDGGTVPVDPSSPYNAGVTVTVLPVGSLTRTGATFAYWNTKADGTGTFYGWPVDTSFTMPSNDVTLYAQWFVTTGLTGGGVTAHYKISYDSSLNGGIEPARTNTLINSVENDYGWMAGLFPQVTPSGPAPIPVYVTRLTGGANNTGDIRLKPNGNDPNELRSILVSEVTESFMDGQHKGWGFLPGVNNEESCGEALSLFLTQQFELVNSIPGPFTAFPGVNWLNSSLPTSNPSSSQLGDPSTTLNGAINSSVTTFSVASAPSIQFMSPYIIQIDNEQMLVTATDTTANTMTVTRGYNGTTATAHVDKAKVSHNYGPRTDYVNSVLPYFGNGPGTGGSQLFLYYLYHQLAFPYKQIIADAPGYKNGVLNATAPLQGVYRNLTGDSTDPFPLFRRVLDAAYPPDQVSSIPGPLPDDPWPLAVVSFLVDKSTFGKFEVQDVIKTSGGKWPKAFWLVVEGFSKNSFNSLGVTVAPFSGAFAGLAGISFSQSPGIDFENAANPQTPQRIRIPFDITFSNAALGSFPAADSQIYELDAALTVGGKPVGGSNGSTLFELVSGADPYFTNIDPSQDNVYYLSQDVRVFTGTPAETNLPVPGGPSFSSDSVDGAHSYIQALLTFLNSNYFDPNGDDPFSLILPSQMGALTGDSSVTPYDNVLDTLYNNYNFAVARVRLRGPAGPAGTAKGVRVFFRLWTTQTADTDFQAATYPAAKDGSGNIVSPQVGTDHHTIPFFATGDLTTNTDYGPSGANIRDITIPSGDSVWAYFGCFLNLYDANNKIDGKQIQGWLTGTHHCIVAQIVFGGAPVIPGASPENSDKLAQRNLAVVTSDNPGPPSTHRIPQTFDIRPSPGTPAPGGPGFDELMIDWGGIPAGSIASIYWPQVQSSDVLALAASSSSAHGLSAADAHTILCKVTEGVTYLPIPPMTGPNLAGLLTIDLPQTVVTGQKFQVVLRRLGTQQGSPVVIPSPPHLPRIASGPVEAAPATPTLTWRYVVGSFQVTIPVATANVMLAPEENTLAIMKWRLAQTPTSSRWYPVLQRYIGVVSARVDGLGGHSTAVPPSPTGFPPRPKVKVEITFPPTNSTFLAGKRIEVRGNATWTPSGPSPVHSMQLSAFESRFDGVAFGRWVHVNDFVLTLVPDAPNTVVWQHEVVPFDGMARYMLTAYAFGDTNTPIGSSEPVFLRSVFGG